MNERSLQAQRRAIRISLIIGAGMFLAKGLAWIMTGSAAILSDASESVVHVVAVAFAAWGLHLSHRPPDRDHPYGHEKVSYFSAGVEGALIAIAAIFIFYESIRKLVVAPEIENLGSGVFLVAFAMLVNAALGLYLVRTGRRERSLILVANGKHVLTDSYTSLGVLGALALVALTGWKVLDPILAMLVAAHILRSGTSLVREAVHGLMDRMDPDIDAKLRGVLDDWSQKTGGVYHGLRHRRGGDRIWVDVHLLFDGAARLDQVHAGATALENLMDRALGGYRVEITSHLEPEAEHERHHPEGGYQHR